MDAGKSQSCYNRLSAEKKSVGVCREGEIVRSSHVRQVQDCAPQGHGLRHLREPEAQAAARITPAVETEQPESVSNVALALELGGRQ